MFQQRWLRWTAVAGLMSLTGCINLLPLHSPIYPDDSDDVTFTLEARATNGIKRVRLYETVSTINAAGTITSTGSETLLRTWQPSGSPVEESFSHVRSGGYGANRLVTYRFHVNRNCGGSRTQKVTFATNPYPVTGQPAPVYAQGDPDDVLDVVFIPDTDITNLDTFYGHCRGMIADAMFAENMVRFWSHQFNFYINAERGTATDYDSIGVDGLHQTPSNWANLSFAEAKALMHQGNLRDYATGGLFSTEQQNRGTMMHEAGHALFGGADEYNSGSHWQAADYPNNWSSRSGAEADAPKRGKTVADVVQMGSTGWWKMCDDDCHLKVSGLTVTTVGYDRPCEDRVTFTVLETASGP